MRIRIVIGAITLAMVSSALHAENYVTAEYDSVKVKSDQLGASFDGYALVGNLRNDFGISGLFGTLAVGTASVDNSDFGVKITVDETLYGFGLGFASHPTAATETYVALKYTHADASASAPGFGSSDSTSDGVDLGVGGHVWFNEIMRGYGEISYGKASHDVSGPGLQLGLEARFAPQFAMYLEYNYSSTKDDSSSPSDTVKATSIGVGIKVPFGGVK